MPSIREGQDALRHRSNRPAKPPRLATLRSWAGQFPNRQLDHYVFPAEKYGVSGDKLEPMAYATDPTQPIKEIKEAWEKAKKRAGAILKGDSDDKEAKPLSCRFHNLGHTAVSRMLDANAPIAKVAKIVGWSPSTMVRMSARYRHFNLEELRLAVETISRTGSNVGVPGISTGVRPRPPPMLALTN